MGKNSRFKYDVDIVFCIDATMSMYPILDTVKANALNFYQDFYDAMNMKGKTVNRLRVRIIAFRDFLADGEEAMMATDFFDLPENSELFEQVVKSIVPDGGGDDPEDGLEALAVAMKSDWCTGPNKKRHVIVVWSDDGTHELGYGKSAPNYLKSMARDFSELTEWWGNGQHMGMMDQNAKRLVIFAPDVPWWTTIANNWNQALHVVTDAGRGLEDCDYSMILDTLKNSV
jgi:hypothetical protein